MAFAAKDIENLLVVAQVGDFANAARTIGITAAALRSSIRRVEEAFGLELLKRNARGARMTDMGERFIEAAQRLSAVHSDAVRLVSEIREGRPRPLRLAFSDPAFSMLVASAISTTSQACPEASITCCAGLTPSLIARGIAAREIDMALTSDAGPAPAGCDSHFLGDDTLQLIVRDDHPMARAPAASLHELSGYRWSIALKSSSVLQGLKCLFAKEQLPLPEFVFQLDNAAALALSIAYRRDLVTLVARSQCAAGIPQGLKVLRLRRLDIARPVHLLTRTDAPDARALSHLREAIVAQAPLLLRQPAAPSA